MALIRCWHFDLGLPIFQNSEKISLCSLQITQSCVLCYRSIHKTPQRTLPFYLISIQFLQQLSRNYFQLYLATFQKYLFLYLNINLFPLLVTKLIAVTDVYSLQYTLKVDTTETNIM